MWTLIVHLLALLNDKEYVTWECLLSVKALIFVI